MRIPHPAGFCWSCAEPFVLIFIFIFFYFFSFLLCCGIVLSALEEQGKKEKKKGNEGNADDARLKEREHP